MARCYVQNINFIHTYFQVDLPEVLVLLKVLVLLELLHFLEMPFLLEVLVLLNLFYLIWPKSNRALFIRERGMPRLYFEPVIILF